MKVANYLMIGWIFIFACNEGRLILNQNDEMTYRRIAWESLSEDAQATVTHSWQEARVSNCTYFGDNSAAVCVTFNTTHDPLLGPIVVYIEPVSLKVLGNGPRF